jgi:hypothetical protein
MPDRADLCVKYAQLAYLWLPLFLAAIAGLCIFIATIRKTLTGGIAAALTSLAGIVVVGAALVAAHQHRETARAEAQAAKPEKKEGHNDAALREARAAIERLQARVNHLEAALEKGRAGATGPVSLDPKLPPPEDTAPLRVAPKPAGAAIPPVEPKQKEPAGSDIPKDEPAPAPLDHEGMPR